MKLYYSPGACSMAAHIALEESGATYQAYKRAIADGENLKPDYRAINPQGRVPALQVGDLVLTELPAILLFVHEQYPQAKLMPAEPLKRAELFSLIAFISSNLHIAFASYWRPERFTDDKSAYPRMAECANLNLLEFFAMIEQKLPANQWLGGNDFSLADINLLPFYRFGWRVGLDMLQFPRYTALIERALKRNSVQHVLEREGIASLKQTP